MIKIESLKLPKIEANDIRSEYLHYRSDSLEFRTQMGEDLEFYLGNQLTTKQKEYLISHN